VILVHEMFRSTVHERAGRTAVVADGVTTTWGDLGEASERLARALQDAGVRRGDRVVLLMDNSVPLVVSLFAVLAAGGVFVVVNPTTKADKLTYLLTDSGARAVVAADRLARVVREASAPDVVTTVWVGHVPDVSAGELSYEAIVGAPAQAPDPVPVIDADLGAIVYTSGSTGDAKGVMLTHRNLHHNAWSISTYLGMRPDDVIACLLPLSFDYGLFQILMSARLGCAVLLERSFAYPMDVMRRIVDHGVTGLPGVPTIFATILGMPSLAELDLSRVRFLTNTAATLPPAHIERLQALFPNATVFSMYGLTECTRVCYLDPSLLAAKPASVGRAMPNTEAYVVDADGNRVPPGTPGELVVRGASVMRGYWNKPDVTAGWLRPGENQGEIVLHTGDQFTMDDDGDLYYLGRTDDIFKCKGEKVSPREIELVLYELDAVGAAAVVGVPDDIDGMAIKAIVAPSGRGELDADVVRKHCRARLESHLVPKHVEIRDALPETDSGKIRKASLR
jgi:amino acid adenylation domain-containing protein